MTEPVFILCNARSGSTLLRFMLDAHPELACPPETNLPGLCAQLATVWSLIEGAPLSANRDDEPPDIPSAAIAGVRETLDRMVSHYLARRGKRQYCDKSLGTARYAALLKRVYPATKFICLYRHPMDMIASGIEACPWGLSGYGFDPYAVANPGNQVMALASYWVDNARAMLAVENQFPDACYRMRYEDLVNDPEATAAAVFSFLGVPSVAGVSQACFSDERERSGPSDHKIWFTSAINADSIGRGWSIPVAMIAPPLLEAMNDLNNLLGYLTLDGEWGTAMPPMDLRIPRASFVDASDNNSTGVDGPAATSQPDMDSLISQEIQIKVPMRSERLGAALEKGLSNMQITQSTADDSFIAVVFTKGAPYPAEHWQVDLRNGTVKPVSAAARDDSDWDVVGTLEAWQKVMDRQINLSVALRSCELRYCDGDDATAPAVEARIALLGHLLGLSKWH